MLEEFITRYSTLTHGEQRNPTVSDSFCCSVYMVVRRPICDQNSNLCGSETRKGTSARSFHIINRYLKITFEWSGHIHCLICVKNSSSCVRRRWITRQILHNYSIYVRFSKISKIGKISTVVLIRERLKMLLWIKNLIRSMLPQLHDNLN